MTARSRSRARRRPLLAAAGAGLLLVAFIAGPPLALALLVGNPLPAHRPGFDGIGHALSSPLSDTALLHLVAAVTWLAWAQLCACIVAELLRQLRGVNIRVPLGGPNARLAQHLVAAVLVATAAGTTGGLTPAVAASPALTAMRVPAPPISRANLPLDRSAVTGAPHSPPRTAEEAASATAPITTPAALAHREYVVAPPHGRHHDNLWDIAGRHLGDPLRWKEIFALNDGRTMPDGQRLTRASLIRPGWVLRMPVDATGIPPLPRHDPEPDGQAVPVQRSVDPRHSAVASQSAATPLAAESTEPVAPHGPASTRPAPAAPAPAQTSHQHNPAIPVGAGLGVAALGVVAALERRRRIAMRRRPHGTRLALPDPLLADAELSLRHRATEARAVADTVRLAVALAAHRDPRPTVPAVVHHVDGALELRLDDDHQAPAPFERRGRTWILRPEHHGYLFAVTDREDPIPVLLPVGTLADGAACYVNLEMHGLTGITGTASSDLDEFLVGVVRALAGAPWAEQTQMVVPARLAAAAEGLERIDVLGDPPQLLDHVAVYARRVAATLPPNATVASSRRDGTTEAVGVIVLVGFTGEELPEELRQAAADPTHPIVALVVADDTATTWRLDGDTLHIPHLDVPVTASRTDATQLDVAARLLAHASEAAPATPDDPQLTALAEDAPPDPTEPDETSVQVNMLGTVELHASGKAERASVREIVLYLALHRRPVQDTVLYARLFPDSEFNRDVIRVRMWEARRLLAGALKHVDQSWGVTEVVISDWQRFQALAAGPPDQQRSALKLVRGRPFDGYEAEWVQAEGHDRVIETAIVDLALTVAERALGQGEDRLATEAVEAGLRASPYEERLYRLGMRAAAARGATGEVRGYMRALKKLLDVHIEPDDHVQPETEQVYRELVGPQQRAV